MNPKQAAPLLASLPALAVIAPPLIIGGVIGLGIVWLIKCAFDSDQAKQPEATPAIPAPETTRKPAEKPAFREIPAIPPASVPVTSASPVAVQPVSVRPVPAVAPAVRPVTKVVQPPPTVVPSPVAKKNITRADMATIFDAGKRSLSRLDAVAALKRLGFGKTAAYSATAPDGRFSAWLVFASDGIIY